MEDTTEQVYFEWVPLKEEGLQVEKSTLARSDGFFEEKDSWYTLLTHQQGILIRMTGRYRCLRFRLQDSLKQQADICVHGLVKDRQGYIAIYYRGMQDTMPNIRRRSIHPRRRILLNRVSERWIIR